MPAALAYVASAVADWVYLEFGYAALATFTYAAVYAAEIYAITRIASALTPDGPRGADRGLEQSLTATDAGGYCIYGKVRCSGVNTIPPITGGAQNRYLEQILSHALHECDSFVDVYADNIVIANADIAAVSGAAGEGLVSGSSIYNGKMWIRRYRGTATQTADFTLTDRQTGFWTTNHRGKGVCYTALSYDWGDGKTFQGRPPTMTFEIKGKKCYDPRLDSSPGADPTNAAFAAWTECPVLCLADYAMADYGGIVPSAGINWASVVTAANICDALVAIPGATTQKRYTFNARLPIVIDPDWRENAKRFVDAMLGRMVRRDGKWFFYAGAYDAPTYTINKTDWLSIERIRTVASRRDGGRYNTVRGWFVDPERNWQRVEGEPARSSAYKTDDGNEEIPLEQEQTACTNKYEIQRKNIVVLRKSRNQIGMSGTLGPKFRQIENGATVALNFEECGWSSKVFRVVAVTLQTDGRIGLAVSEEQSTDWDDPIAGDYVTPGVASVPAPGPTTPSAPQNFNIVAINNTLQFTWDAPGVVPVGTQYIIWSAPFSLSVPSSKTVAWIGDALGKQISFNTSSTFYYQVQAVANSSFSDYVPNTFGRAVAAVITPPGGGSWGVSILPSAVYKSATTAKITTGGVQATVVGSAAAVFSWFPVSSCGIMANSPGAAFTTFTNSTNMAVGETRAGFFKLNVVDSGSNVAVNTLDVGLSRDSPT